MEIWKTLQSQSNLKNENQSWRKSGSPTSDSTTKLQLSKDFGTDIETEIKESIPFTIGTKRIKYLGINLPKETKELYTENYKTLIKEIKTT